MLASARVALLHLSARQAPRCRREGCKPCSPRLQRSRMLLSQLLASIAGIWPGRRAGSLASRCPPTGVAHQGLSGPGCSGLPPVEPLAQSGVATIATAVKCRTTRNSAPLIDFRTAEPATRPLYPADRQWPEPVKVNRRTSSCRVRAAVGRVAGHVRLHLALTDRRPVAFVLVQAFDHFLVRACCCLGSITRPLLRPSGAGATEWTTATAINPKCRTVPATALRPSPAWLLAVLPLGLPAYHALP